MNFLRFFHPWWGCPVFVPILTPRNAFPGESHSNTMTAAQRGNAYTGATRTNDFAVVKHGSTEGGIE